MWLSVAQSRSHAVWRFPPFRLSVAQCCSVSLIIAPLTRPAPGGRGRPFLSSVLYLPSASSPPPCTTTIPPESVGKESSRRAPKLRNPFPLSHFRRSDIFYSCHRFSPAPLAPPPILGQPVPQGVTHNGRNQGKARHSRLNYSAVAATKRREGGRRHSERVHNLLGVPPLGGLLLRQASEWLSCLHASCGTCRPPLPPKPDQPRPPARYGGWSRLAPIVRVRRRHGGDAGARVDLTVSRAQRLARPGQNLLSSPPQCYLARSAMSRRAAVPFGCPGFLPGQGPRRRTSMVHLARMA